MKDLIHAAQVNPHSLNRKYAFVLPITDLSRDLDAKAVDITSHLMSMAGGIKTLQAESRPKASSLLDGAKAVSDSLTDMLALMGQVSIFFSIIDILACR